MIKASDAIKLTVNGVRIQRVIDAIARPGAKDLSESEQAIARRAVREFDKLIAKGYMRAVAKEHAIRGIIAAAQRFS